jgi:hypothetical protein
VGTASLGSYGWPLHEDGRDGQGLRAVREEGVEEDKKDA